MTGTERILSRIFIQSDGNVVVTDFWEELTEILEGLESEKEHADTSVQKWDSFWRGEDHPGQ